MASRKTASKKLLHKTVCVVGLGYVGLPLAEAFAAHLRTIGYRRDQAKVDDLNGPRATGSRPRPTRRGSARPTS